MKAKTKAGLCLLGNLVIVFFTILCVSHFFTKPQGGFMAVEKANCFRYFTIDSNILCAVSACVAGIFCIKALKTGELTLPLWAQKLIFSGASALLLTFFTVMLFLGPTKGYGPMIGGDGAYMHVAGPILALLLCWAEIGRLPKKAFILGILPMVIYGIVYTVMVMGVGKWPDFYGFAENSKWYVSVIAMLVLQVVICFGLNALHPKRKAK